MSEINHFLESLDLRSLHWAMSFAGVLLCVYSMQLWSTGLIGDIEKCVTVNGLRRVALWMLALAFVWSLGYAEYHPRWQPWPPDLAAIIAVDLFLFATIVGAYIRKRDLRRVPG